MGEKITSCYPDPETVICLNPEDSALCLAYQVNIRAIDPFSHHYVYVDAKNGNILNKVSRIHYFIPGATGTAVTKYSGTQYIPTQVTSFGYTLNDQNTTNKREMRAVYQGPGSTTDPQTGYKFTNQSTYWTTTNHPAALDAYWGFMVTTDYFITKYNFPLSHLPPINICYIQTIYFGDFNSNPVHDTCYDEKLGYILIAHNSNNVSLDAIAHEHGHSVNYNTARVGMGDNVEGLEPFYINEGLSDIWATCVDNYAINQFSGMNSKNKWMIGDEITPSPYIYGVRSLSHPQSMSYPDTYQGNYWNTQPTGMKENHSRGCVLGHWFYILSEGKSGTNDHGHSYNVTKIGIDKAEKIVWRAQTHYITRNTDFADARYCTIMAAKDLYGAGSNEVITVKNAWDAVGVYEITGVSSSVCLSGNSFNLGVYFPPNMVVWETSNPFTATVDTSNSAFVTVKKTGWSNNNSTLIAKIGGKEVARKTITPCQARLEGYNDPCLGAGECWIVDLPPAFNDSLTWDCTSNLQLINKPGNPLTKGIKVVSRDDIYGIVYAKIGSITIAQKGVDIVAFGYSPVLTGSNSLTAGQVETYTLERFTNPGILLNDGTTLESTCYVVSWSCSSNLQILSPAQVAGYSCDGTTAEEPDESEEEFESDFPEEEEEEEMRRGDPEPEQEEDPPTEWSESAVIKALSSGSGWINATICLNGISMSVQKYVHVFGGVMSVQIIQQNPFNPFSNPPESPPDFVNFSSQTSPSATQYIWYLNSNTVSTSSTLQLQYASDNFLTKPNSLKLWASDGTLSSYDEITIYGDLIDPAMPVEEPEEEEDEGPPFPSCCGEWLSYPNPVSNTLILEIDYAKVATKTASRGKQDITYDIRLYDGLGNLLRQSTAKGGNVEFNVSSLSDGIYYLYIYDGISEKPDVRQIIVEH